MNIKKHLSHPSNYTATGGREIKYIVIHYTANDGDTAIANCKYFAGAGRGASAHYFVDSTEVWQSVEDRDKAWHCGGDVYYHPACRNSNSIGIEICSHRASKDRYYFDQRAVERAIELTRAKMAEYGIPAANVVRHYDVTHKKCPAPFVDDAEAWAGFKKALEADDMKQYQTLDDAPEWARPTLKKLMNDGSLAGDGNGNINVSEDFCRIMVVLDRRGKL